MSSTDFIQIILMWGLVILVLIYGISAALHNYRNKKISNTLLYKELLKFGFKDEGGNYLSFNFDGYQVLLRLYCSPNIFSLNTIDIIVSVKKLDERSFQECKRRLSSKGMRCSRIGNDLISRTTYSFIQPKMKSILKKRDKLILVVKEMDL